MISEFAKTTAELLSQKNMDVTLLSDGVIVHQDVPIVVSHDNGLYSIRYANQTRELAKCEGISNLCIKLRMFGKIRKG